MRTSTYSWILPIRNEANSLSQLVVEIQAVMGKSSYEIVAINDGSTDATSLVLKKHAKRTTQLRVLSFEKPQGKWAALVKGFSASSGEIVITLDSDLQDDPGELPKILTKLDEGYDIVSGWRKKRYDPFYKVAISRLGNRLASFFTGRRFFDLNSPYKVYRRHVLSDLPVHGAMLRFSLLFAHKLGYNVVEVPIAHRKRRFGRSKFGIVKYIRIIYDLLLILLLFSGSGKIKKKGLV